MIGFNFNGASYFYIRNLQGDIVGIYDLDGTVQAWYTYDAWGNPGKRGLDGQENREGLRKQRKERWGFAAALCGTGIRSRAGAQKARNTAGCAENHRGSRGADRGAHLQRTAGGALLTLAFN